MDIILAQDQYDEYEKVILKRDRVRKEADEIHREYIRVFGDLIERSFSLKVDCIRLKKMIGYCQLQPNQGRPVDPASMLDQVAAEMEAYVKQLVQLRMIRNDHGKTISEYAALQIRQIYREIAKAIHPDMNPVLYQHEEVQELWERVVLAYRCNDLPGLEELQVLVNKAIEKYSGEAVYLYIPDIAERIAKIEAEIEEIITTDPYLLRLVLEDEAACEEKKKALLEEIEAYTVYKQELTAILAGYGIEDIEDPEDV